MRWRRRHQFMRVRTIAMLAADDTTQHWHARCVRSIAGYGYVVADSLCLVLVSESVRRTRRARISGPGVVKSRPWRRVALHSLVVSRDDGWPSIASSPWFSGGTPRGASSSTLQSYKAAAGSSRTRLRCSDDANAKRSVPYVPGARTLSGAGRVPRRTGTNLTPAAARDAADASASVLGASTGMWPERAVAAICRR